MALSAFDDKSEEPKVADLKIMLGRSGVHWDALVDHAETEYAPLEKTWNYAGAKWGWSLRLRQKKRTVLYMTPLKRHFLVGLVLGEKAAAAAGSSSVSNSILALLDEAPKYAEGRAVRIEVRTKKDLEIVRQLAAVKMAN